MDARQDAIAHMDSACDGYGRVPCPNSVRLDAIPTDVLQRLHDERVMAFRHRQDDEKVPQ